ncbi:MAG: ribonuclease J [Magnetovibrionaceae bacterium]
MSRSSDDQLLFLPLGGAGEIGMNLNLYGYGPEGDERWMMVDLGVTFGNPGSPVDVMMPDPAFIEDRLHQLDGIVLTHGHEDHLGAVPYLWHRFRKPVFATPFTAALLRRKMGEAGFPKDLDLTEVPLSGSFRVGPFDLELVTLTHSIPEPNAILIRTPKGTVVHTGDWKLDPDPVVGETADENRLAQAGEEGVLAIVCDSTNVFQPGEAGSEADLLEPLTELIAEQPNRVIITCFASNLARLETIAKAARANDRDVILAGRSLWRITEVARETGYLKGVPDFLTEHDAGYIPREKTLIICTGSQGEPRAALAKLASAEHPRIDLERGDTVIFSSREIPGNETSIATMQNRLIQRGIKVVTDRDLSPDKAIHVSGHPCRDELARMYAHVRPRVAVPVHGEARHLVEHAKLAAACQVPSTVVAQNGSMVRLDGGEPGIVDEVHAGRLALDGNQLIAIDSDAMRERRRALFNGVVVASLVVDKDGRLELEPQITLQGLPGDPDDLEDECLDIIEDCVERLPRVSARNDESLSEAVRIALRRHIRTLVAKRPYIEVQLFRL